MNRISNTETCWLLKQKHFPPTLFRTRHWACANLTSGSCLSGFVWSALPFGLLLTWKIRMLVGKQAILLVPTLRYSKFHNFSVFAHKDDNKCKVRRDVFIVLFWNSLLFFSVSADLVLLFLYLFFCPWNSLYSFISSISIFFSIF